MFGWVVARLRPQSKTKINFLENCSSPPRVLPFGHPILEKISKNVDFSLWSKQCCIIVLPKWTFFRVVLAHCVVSKYCFYSHCICYAGHSGWDPAEKEKFARCEMSRRDHTSSRLKGHDPGRNQCPVFCETRGRSEAARGNWGIQK